MDDSIDEFDWRHWAVVTLAQDLPAAFPGGPSHKAGSKGTLSTMTKDRLGRYVSFNTPSPTALALSASISAARRADRARAGLSFAKLVSPMGSTRGVPTSESTQVFDFFEECMIAVVFAFNAVEMFCNQTIADRLGQGTFSRTTKKGEQHFDSAQAQRGLSTEEKLSVVLPELLSSTSPFSTGIWQSYKTLKRIRNSTIHLKSEEAYNQGEPDRRSLFDEFFHLATVMTFPICAIEIIGYFSKSVGGEGRWLAQARSKAGMRA